MPFASIAVAESSRDWWDIAPAGLSWHVDVACWPVCLFPWGPAHHVRLGTVVGLRGRGLNKVSRRSNQKMCGLTQIGIHPAVGEPRTRRRRVRGISGNPAPTTVQRALKTVSQHSKSFRMACQVLMLKHAIHMIVLGRVLRGASPAILGKQSRPRVVALWVDSVLGEEVRLDFPSDSHGANPVPTDIFDYAYCISRRSIVAPS